jgi:hypothetical protein
VAVSIAEPVPQYHKFAVRRIRRGAAVRKYGEIIGRATGHIAAGCYVHEHNIASPPAKNRRENP